MLSIFKLRRDNPFRLGRWVRQPQVGHCDYVTQANLGLVSYKPVGLRASQDCREVVGDVVKDMLENNEAIPEPIAAKKFSGKFMVRIPPDLHRNLAIQAVEAGISLNRLTTSKLAN